MFGLQLKPLNFTNCFFKGGGGSSSGSGGSSGRVDYPTYMKTAHGQWLDDDGVDVLTDSTAGAMEAALGASPWSGESAYNPATPLAAAWTAVCAYNTVVDALDESADWLGAMSTVETEVDANIYDDDFISNKLLEYLQDIGLAIELAETAVDSVIDDSSIEADTDAFSTSMDDVVDNTMTKFRTGMRNINAVNSSAFVLGEAILFGMKGRDVAQHESASRVKLNEQRNTMIVGLLDGGISLTKAGVTYKMTRDQLIINAADRVLQALLARVEFEKAVAGLSIEAKRIHIVASREETQDQLDIDESDAKWDLEVFGYGANMLAAIGGGTAVYDQQGKSTTMSALAGAMSGAAMGASVGGGYGAVVGGVLGLGAALMA